MNSQIANVHIQKLYQKGVLSKRNNLAIHKTISNETQIGKIFLRNQAYFYLIFIMSGPDIVNCFHVFLK